MGGSDAYAPLCELLGHRFTDGTLLERALTHKSFLNENPQAVASGRQDNERLEFLGDAVIGMAIAHLLMETFPSRTEGELSRARARIVSEQGLAQIAATLGLGEWLFLGRGEEVSGGRRKPSLLADACEAVIAAIYLDAGFVVALDVARRLFAALVNAGDDPGSSDYKSTLQELAQAHLHLQPRYTVIGAVGPDHDKTFEVAVTIGEREYARASGRTRKEAEQRAAERALAILGPETVT